MQVEHDVKALSFGRICQSLGVAQIVVAARGTDQHAQADAVDALVLEDGHECLLLALLVVERLALLGLQCERADVGTEIKGAVGGSAVEDRLGDRLNLVIGDVVVLVGSGEIAALDGPVTVKPFQVGLQEDAGVLL